MRLTIQRRAILADVLGSDQHREIDEIYLSLKDAGIPISRATIYRTLDILVQVDFVHKMDIGDGRFRYENNLTGDRGARALIDVHPANVVEVSVSDDGIFRDIDLPEDVA